MATTGATEANVQAPAAPAADWPAPVRDPVDVLVVDDHRTFAEALATALEVEGLTTRVSGGSLALEAIGSRPPDVVLVAVDHSGRNGVDVVRRIREAHPALPVVVLSGSEDDLLRARALEAGAAGCLTKLTPLVELPQALRRASRGKSLVEAEEAARLLRFLRRRRHQEATEQHRASRLTPRQTQILQMVADGVPVSEIATGLGMSRLTLRTHVQNILTRLGVHTKAEAVTVAIRHGKISTGI